RFLRQRAIHERLLLALGRLDDVVADVAEQEVDLEPRRLDVLEQRRRERRVAAVAVGGGGAVPRRVGDQDVAGRLDARQAARGGAGAGRALHLGGGRVVAAGMREGAGGGCRGFRPP